MKKTKLLLSVAMAGAFLFSAGCNKPQESLSATDYNYSKTSAELLQFKSSDSELDAFLNDYFKRHSGYVDKNGLDQKVNSVTAGVNAKQFFWQEWNSMSYYWYNSFDGYETDRMYCVFLDSVRVDEAYFLW